MSPYLSGAGEISVLIVDDDEVSREVLATILTIEGYEVQTAHDGGEALAMLDSGSYKPQVVLTDLHMPGLQGASLILKLRERIPLGCGTLLLAMSASEPRAGEVEGADGFLRKPFGAKELKWTLQESHHEPRAAAVQPKKAAQVLDFTSSVPDFTSPSVPDATGGEAAVLNHSKLEGLRALMPETSVRQIYVTVIDDLARRMPGLEDAIGHGDAKMVRSMGHAIKGGCSMVGAAEAARLGAMLEAESDNLDNCNTLAAQLRSAIEALKDKIDREFSK
jgi:CheY-like chemotaxis protein